MYKVVSLTVENTSGIDALLAQKVVQVASEYDSDIMLKYMNKEVDLKSILGIMSLAVLEGAKIDIEAKGDDAEEAISRIKSLLIK